MKKKTSPAFILLPFKIIVSRPITTATSWLLVPQNSTVVWIHIKELYWCIQWFTSFITQGHFSSFRNNSTTTFVIFSVNQLMPREFMQWCKSGELRGNCCNAATFASQLRLWYTVRYISWINRRIFISVCLFFTLLDICSPTVLETWCMKALVLMVRWWVWIHLDEQLK